MIINLIVKRKFTLIFSTNLSRLLNNQISNRVLEILPQISNHIQWLNIDSLTLESSLVSTTYPQLKTIVLHISSPKSANSLFLGKIFSSILS
jgi:hypothetical protein